MLTINVLCLLLSYFFDQVFFSFFQIIKHWNYTLLNTYLHAYLNHRELWWHHKNLIDLLLIMKQLKLWWDITIQMKSCNLLNRIKFKISNNKLKQGYSHELMDNFKYLIFIASRLVRGMLKEVNDSVIDICLCWFQMHP